MCYVYLSLLGPISGVPQQIVVLTLFVPCHHFFMFFVEIGVSNMVLYESTT
jgi:hypothetical protein